MEDLSVSEFISILNNYLDENFPLVNVVGELANFRISKNKWIYFDLKDEKSSLKFFGSVYKLKKPIEEGMLLRVSCAPYLHPNYGFSMQVVVIEPFGEGSIQKANQLLADKLAKEGLFDPDKKRTIIYPPTSIGLITSEQSAAYSDFRKILNERWMGIDINLYDVQVQGDKAIPQIIRAIDYFNNLNTKVDVLVMIRGGGSPDDLAAFNDEALTRKVASSKIPTLVAIGHEIDVSLAELAADKRASTPSNAAELLVPDKKTVEFEIVNKLKTLNLRIDMSLSDFKDDLLMKNEELGSLINSNLDYFNNGLINKKRILEAYNPKLNLKRGYSIVRFKSKVLNSSKLLKKNDKLAIELYDGKIESKVEKLG